MTRSGPDWGALQEAVARDVVFPDSPAYRPTRKPAIARYHDVRPQAVVLCATPADVSETISFASRSGLPTAGRSGDTASPGGPRDRYRRHGDALRVGLERRGNGGCWGASRRRVRLAGRARQGERRSPSSPTVSKVPSSKPKQPQVGRMSRWQVALNVIREYLNLSVGLMDEVQIHLVPMLLGGGVRLFGHLGPESIELEKTRVIESTGVTHLRFRVVK